MHINYGHRQISSKNNLYYLPLSTENRPFPIIRKILILITCNCSSLELSLQFCLVILKPSSPYFKQVRTRVVEVDWYPFMCIVMLSLKEILLKIVLLFFLRIYRLLLNKRHDYKYWELFIICRLHSLHNDFILRIANIVLINNTHLLNFTAMTMTS